MKVIAQFEPNLKTQYALNKIPDEVLYAVAKETLDMTYSKEYFPKKTTTMERSSMSGGVRGGNHEYYIGSFTDYASRVWNYPQETTNWTNPLSKSQWYAYTLKHFGQLIIDTAVTKAWKDNL